MILPFFLLAILALCHGAFYEDNFARLHDQVKMRTTRWEMGYNKRFEGMSKQELARFLGARRGDKSNKAPKKIFNRLANGRPMPETFDSRDYWPMCSKQIGFIRDQANCGSCWAVSSAEVMTDRTCIHSNGTKTPYISDEDILTCCSECGDGCDGGWPIEAMRFWMEGGVVTGGPYGSHEGCRPYTIPPGGPSAPTPKCKKRCEVGYNTTYPLDEHKASTYYYVAGGPDALQEELMDRGPFVADFDVYEDFYYYSSGIYHHVTGDFVGGHAVKVIGWGTDNGTPYWLVANSWNESWGMQGHFKIMRGTNECGFEYQPAAGIPG